MNTQSYPANQKQYSQVWRKSNPRPMQSYTIGGITVSGVDLQDARRTVRKMKRLGLA